MVELPDEEAVLARIGAWADANDAVRALVLTSGRARRDDSVDALSDYDVVVLMTDLARFDPAAAYGTPLARWADEDDVHGVRKLFRGVVYEDWVKIDWSLWPVQAAGLVADRGLTDDLDVGYRVLLDKDGLTAGWASASYRAHIPSPPTEEEYRAVVEEFWWSASYVAKSLWRDERYFTRWVLDVDLRHGVLRRMLEWRAELDHGWSIRPGAYGRGLEHRLSPEIRAGLFAAYDAGGGWEAFDRTAELFRRVAKTVGDALGYRYPQCVDDLASAHLTRLRT